MSKTTCKYAQVCLCLYGGCACVVFLPARTSNSKISKIDVLSTHTHINKLSFFLSFFNLKSDYSDLPTPTSCQVLVLREAQSPWLGEQCWVWTAADPNQPLHFLAHIPFTLGMCNPITSSPSARGNSISSNTRETFFFKGTLWQCMTLSRYFLSDLHI